MLHNKNLTQLDQQDAVIVIVIGCRKYNEVVQADQLSKASFMVLFVSKYKSNQPDMNTLQSASIDLKLSEEIQTFLRLLVCD